MAPGVTATSPDPHRPPVPHPRHPAPRGGGAARPVEILLVEDNPGDVELTREALHETRLRVRLSVVGDGAEALAYLRREREYAGAPRPDLVLLDLNLPKVDGRRVLAEAKQDPALRDIPVVVLTSSQADQDVARVYALHANCYVTKPVDLDEFVRIVRSIEEFWLTVAELPRSG